MSGLRQALVCQRPWQEPIVEAPALVILGNGAMKAGKVIDAGSNANLGL